jgi:hypothetical protein
MLAPTASPSAAVSRAAQIVGLGGTETLKMTEQHTEREIIAFSPRTTVFSERLLSGEWCDFGTSTSLSGIFHPQRRKRVWRAGYLSENVKSPKRKRPVFNTTKSALESASRLVGAVKCAKGKLILATGTSAGFANWATNRSDVRRIWGPVMSSVLDCDGNESRRFSHWSFVTSSQMGSASVPNFPTGRHCCYNCWH